MFIATCIEASKRGERKKAVSKIFIAGVALVIVIVTPSLVCAQADPVDGTPLSNKDVLFMVQQKLEPAVILSTIRSSPCTFDTFPPVLLEMKRKGVSGEVLQAMIEAPYGPSTRTLSQDDLGEAPIYHYADQLRQMGFITLSTSDRSTRSTRQRSRATRARRRL